MKPLLVLLYEQTQLNEGAIYINVPTEEKEPVRKFLIKAGAKILISSFAGNESNWAFKINADSIKDLKDIKQKLKAELGVVAHIGTEQVNEERIKITTKAGQHMSDAAEEILSSRKINYTTKKIVDKGVNYLNKGKKVASLNIFKKSFTIY